MHLFDRPICLMAEQPDPAELRRSYDAIMEEKLRELHRRQEAMIAKTHEIAALLRSEGLQSHAEERIFKSLQDFQNIAMTAGITQYYAEQF